MCRQKEHGWGCHLEVYNRDDKTLAIVPEGFAQVAKPVGVGHDHGYGDPERSFGYKVVPAVAIVAKILVLNMSHLLSLLLTARTVMAHSQGLRQPGWGGLMLKFSHRSLLTHNAPWLTGCQPSPSGPSRVANPKGRRGFHSTSRSDTMESYPSHRQVFGPPLLLMTLCRLNEG